MGQIIKLQFDPKSTDDEIRQIAHQALNGEYTDQICRNCGRYWNDAEGNWKTAEILKLCRDCVVIPGIPSRSKGAE